MKLKFLTGCERPTKNNASHYFIQVFDQMKQIGIDRNPNRYICSGKTVILILLILPGEGRSIDWPCKRQVVHLKRGLLLFAVAVQ